MVATATAEEEEEEWPSWSPSAQGAEGAGRHPAVMSGVADDGDGVFETVRVQNKLFPSFGFGSAVAKVRSSFNAQIEKSRPAVSQLNEKLHLTEKVAVLSKQVEDFKKTAAVIDTNEENKIRARRNFMTLDAIITSNGCTARTLTVSDQHASLLLTHNCKGNIGDLNTSYRGGEKDEVKFESDAQISSLLKLTVVPFHKKFLGKQTTNTDKGENQTDCGTMTDDQLESSRKILSFLSQYRFNLKSESGAEYSYYDATPSRPPAIRTPRGEVGLVGAFNKALNGISGSLAGEGMLHTSVAENEKKGTGDVGPTRPSEPMDVALGSFTAELISPASERQVQRAMPFPVTALVEETPELYCAVTYPLIAEIVSGGSLDWITNVIEGKKEKERILLDHKDYILNVDTKWRSHPDCNSVPRDQWYKQESTDDLYCLAILKQRGVASLRDLTAEHVPILRSILMEGTLAIKRVYGVPFDQIRVFVHYQPQFYHFHVHFTRLQNEIGCQVERGHLVSSIIQNLEMDPEYYSKRTITYRLKLTDELYKRIVAHRNSTTGVEIEESTQEKEIDFEVTEENKDIGNH